MRGQKPVVIAAVMLCGLSLTTGSAVADDYRDPARPGSDGAGDSYYPQDGNGGYDVADYNLKISYDPASHQLTGKQNITARATQSLSSFNLRNYIGQDAFDRVLKTWPALHRNGNASMQDFQRYSELVAHRNLQGFFDAWVYGAGKPADEYLFPGALKP